MLKNFQKTFVQNLFCFFSRGRISQANTFGKTKKLLKKLALAAQPDDLDESFKLSKAQKLKVVAQRRVRQAEENCLARAVW